MIKFNIVVLNYKVNIDL